MQGNVMYCEHCGARTPDYSRFCEQCGQPITGRQAQPSAIPAAQSPYPARAGRQRRPRPLDAPHYQRIVFWIRSKAGSRIQPGLAPDQVRQELQRIYAGEKARGIPDIALWGFRSYIEQQEYDLLLRMR